MKTIYVVEFQPGRKKRWEVGIATETVKEANSFIKESVRLANLRKDQFRVVKYVRN